MSVWLKHDVSRASTAYRWGHYGEAINITAVTMLMLRSLATVSLA